MNFRAQTILAENLCCNREIGVIPDQLTKKKLSAFPGHNVEKTSWTTFHSWPSFMTQSWAKLKKRQKGIQKIREIVGSHLCMQRFHKFWMWRAGNRKWKLCKFTGTCNKKLVKITLVELFSAVFCHLKPLYDAKLDRHHHSYIYFFFLPPSSILSFVTSMIGFLEFWEDLNLEIGNLRSLVWTKLSN